MTKLMFFKTLMSTFVVKVGKLHVWYNNFGWNLLALKIQLCNLLFMLCEFVVVVCSGLRLLSTIFQSYHNKELNAHFYSAASLKYHAPDT